MNSQAKFNKVANKVFFTLTAVSFVYVGFIIPVQKYGINTILQQFGL